MPPPARLSQLNPQKLWLVMTVSGILLLVLATAGGVFLGLKQNQTLVQNENKMMLRRNGELLMRQNVRTFVESLGFDERDYRLSIVSELDHQKLSFGKLAQSGLIQCSSENYFQFQVQLCRPPPISWPAIATIFAIFAALIGAVSLLMRKLGIQIVDSFQDLFKVAHIQAPRKMNFNQAWTTAFSMAKNFKDFQTKLLEAEKNRAIIDLSRQVAHDIRSPLTALNFLAACLDGVAPEKISLVKQAIKRIDDIANELLQKSKSQTEERPAPLNLATAIEEVLKEKEFEFQDRTNLHIEFHAETAEAFTDLNATDFARLLSNLINNSVEAKSSQINISLKSLKNEVEIAIVDNGIGISPEHLKRIGEANFSLKSDGNGLGVPHAISTIESIGGKFLIDSEPDHGSTVRILLPKLTP